MAESLAWQVNLRRLARGERHGRAILSEQDVRDIRSEYALFRVTMQELGIRYGVCRTTIHLIIQRKRWTHV